MACPRTSHTDTICHLLELNLVPQIEAAEAALADTRKRHEELAEQLECRRQTLLQLRGSLAYVKRVRAAQAHLSSMRASGGDLAQSVGYIAKEGTKRPASSSQPRKRRKTSGPNSAAGFNAFMRARKDKGATREAALDEWRTMDASDRLEWYQTAKQAQAAKSAKSVAPKSSSSAE